MRTTPSSHHAEILILSGLLRPSWNVTMQASKGIRSALGLSDFVADGCLSRGSGSKVKDPDLLIPFQLLRTLPTTTILVLNDE